MVTFSIFMGFRRTLSLNSAFLIHKIEFLTATNSRCIVYFSTIMPTLSAIASQLFRSFNFIALNIDDVFTALIEYMAHIGWRPPFSNLMLVLDDGPFTQV